MSVRTIDGGMLLAYTDIVERSEITYIVKAGGFSLRCLNT